MPVGTATTLSVGTLMSSEPTRREFLARAVVDAWRRNEPDGMLLIELYKECGMSEEDARATLKKLQQDSQERADQ